jgi:hypothetical protein
MLGPDPTQRPRQAEVRDRIIARIAEAARGGRLGGSEGLEISFAGAEQRLDQLGAEEAGRKNAIFLGYPSFPQIPARRSMARVPE